MTNMFVNEEQPRGTVKSILKATALLRLFTIRQPEWGVSELSRALNMHKTVVYNFAETLVSGGLLDKDRASRRYRVGLLAYQLGLVFGNRNDFYDTARSVLASVRDKTNHTMQLGILDEGEVFVIVAVESSTRLRVISMEGERRPAYASGVGRAILSTLSAEQLESTVPDVLPAHTPATITDRDELLSLLNTARECGHVMQEDELVANITSVAVPVRDSARRGVAGISASFLSTEKESIDIEALADLLSAAAADLSSALGDNLRGMADRSRSPLREQA